MRQLFFLVAALSLASPARAQRSAPPAPAPPPFIRVGLESDVVAGAPYSADIVNESVQVLSDGNRIVHRTTSRVYRDVEGRTRRETDRPNRTPEVIVTDPVSARSWTLDLDTKVARERPMPRFLQGAVNRGGQLEALTVMLNGQLTSFVARGGNGGFIVGGPNDQTAEEKLTQKTIEGLRVDGTRRTTTIAAGAIGNERPIVVTSEQWTSPELKVQVLSESNDPRTGTSTYKLVNVKRADPPASLFQVPADFTVTAVQEGRGARGGAPQR